MSNMTEIKKRAKNITTSIDTPAGDVFNMSVFEMSRWLALLKGMGHIETTAKRFKMNLDDNDDWIQPIALEKYIGEVSDDILLNLMNDEEFMKTTLTA